MQVSNEKRYMISDPINGRLEYFPTGESSFKLTFEYDDPLKHTPTEKFTGDLVFIGADYWRLKALEVYPNQQYLCTQLVLEIEGLQNGVWVVEKTANFKLLAGEWDSNRCQVRINPSIISTEDRIKNAPDVNLFSLVDVESRITVSTANKFGENVNINSYFIEKFSTSKRNIGSPIAGNGWEPPPGKEGEPIYLSPETSGYSQDYLENISNKGPLQWYYDPNAAVDKWYQWCKREKEFLGTEYIKYASFVRYVKWIPLSDPLPPGTIDLLETSGSERKIAKTPQMTEWETMYEGQWKDRCGVQKVELRTTKDAPNAPLNPAPENLIDNGISLKDALSFLVAGFGVTVQSRFFNINSLYTSDANTNYVTTQKSTTADIVLFQKSDVKRWNNTFGGNATLFMISPKTLIETLCKGFNCKWGVVNGVLLIEHVSFFIQAGSLNLTTAQYLKYLEGKTKYNYISETFPVKEVFTFMEKSREIESFSDFNGVPIMYNNDCTTSENSGKEEPTALEKVTNDIQALMDVGEKEFLSGQQSGEFSNDGFVLASCLFVPEGIEQYDNDGLTIRMIYHFVITKAAIIDFTSRINNVFGWAHLHADFFRYERYFPIGSMNNLTQNFFSVKANRQSEPITFLYCDPIQNFNPNILVGTQAGYGKIQSASYSFSKKTMELKLNYLRMIDEPWDGNIYARYTIESLDPVVEMGECELEPDVIRELTRQEEVILKAEFFKDPIGITPHLREPDTFPNVLVKRIYEAATGETSETIIDLMPTFGSSVAVFEGSLTLNEWFDCGNMKSYREIATFEIFGTEGGVILI